eukprot:363580-Chlamydomonas_euryale.AAC.11
MVMMPSGLRLGMGPYVPSGRPRKRRCVRGVPTSLNVTALLMPGKRASMRRSSEAHSASCARACTALPFQKCFVTEIERLGCSRFETMRKSTSASSM